MIFSISEGMSAYVRSHQPPEQRAQKRSRVQDVDSGGSTWGSRCRYHGCEKPTWGNGRSEFCGNTHKELFMANLADMLEHGGAAGSSHGNRMCMLPGCDLPVRLNSEIRYDFCRLAHYNQYVKICTPLWYKKGRLCKLEGCLNHVWVEERTKKLHEFCGKKCLKWFSARSGLSSLDENPRTLDAPKVDEKGPNGDEIPNERASQEDLEQDDHEKVKRKLGYHSKSPDSTEDMEKCLKHVVLHLRDPSENFCTGKDISKYLHSRDLADADPSEKFCTGIDISKKHPWELNESEGDEDRYFLLMYDSSRKNGRTTKERFGWKQSSSKYPGKVQTRLLTGYFFYKFRDKNNDTSDDHRGGHIVVYRQHNEAKEKGNEETDGSESRWKMHEHRLSDDAIKEVTGGSLPRYRPKICKIFQDKEGRPVWPPTRQDKEETPAITENGNAVVSVGTIPDPAFPWGGNVTSSISSNLLPHSDLSFSRETLMGSNSEETGEFFVPTFPEDDTNPMLQHFLLDLSSLGTP